MLNAWNERSNNKIVYKIKKVNKILIKIVIKWFEVMRSYFQIKWTVDIQRTIFHLYLKWFIENRPDPWIFGFAVKNQIEGHTMLLSLAPVFFKLRINLVFFDWKFLQTTSYWNLWPFKQSSNQFISSSILYIIEHLNTYVLYIIKF